MEEERTELRRKEREAEVVDTGCEKHDDGVKKKLIKQTRKR